MIWDYKNLSSKTSSSWWFCSENECCVKADSEKVRQRETDRVAGHIHLGTHHHHHSIIMLLNIVCSWTYEHLGTHHHPHYYPQCCRTCVCSWTYTSESSSCCVAGHIHLSHHHRDRQHHRDCQHHPHHHHQHHIMQLGIYTTVFITPSSWIIIIIWEDNTAWNEAQSGHCLTVQRDIKFMKRNESHLQIIFPFYGSSI